MEEPKGIESLKETLCSITCRTTETKGSIPFSGQQLNFEDGSFQTGTKVTFEYAIDCPHKPSKKYTLLQSSRITFSKPPAKPVVLDLLTHRMPAEKLVQKHENAFPMRFVWVEESGTEHVWDVSVPGKMAKEVRRYKRGNSGGPIIVDTYSRLGGSETFFGLDIPEFKIKEAGVSFRVKAPIGKEPIQGREITITKWSIKSPGYYATYYVEP